MHGAARPPKSFFAMNTGNLPTVYEVRAPGVPGQPKESRLQNAVVFSRAPAPAGEACLLRSMHPLLHGTDDGGRMRRVCSAVVGAYRGRHQAAGCFVCGKQRGVSCYLMPQGDGPLVVILCCEAAACADVAPNRVNDFLDEQGSEV